MGERLTVLTWLWSQPTAKTRYAAEHVNAWRAMVAQHLTIDHEVACVTDMAEGIDPRVRIIPPPGDFVELRLPTWGPRKPQCLRRLSMFRRDAADWLRADRIVCMDLDVVIVGSLDPLLDIDDDFKIAHGTTLGRKYNGSLMSLRLGARPQVFETFTHDKAILAGLKHVGSDQAWIAATIPGEKTWTAADGVRFWLPNKPMQGAKVIFFPGPLKPWGVEDPLVKTHYPAGGGQFHAAPG